MKNKIFILVLGIFLINFIFAAPEIPTVYINTQTPLLTQDVVICADVNDTETISLVRIYLSRENPEWAWGLVMDFEEDGVYCKVLSAETMRVNEIEEDYVISFYITAKNSLGETATTPTYYFEYQEESVAFCGDDVCNGNETCENCEQDCGVCVISSTSSPKNSFVQYCEPNWKCGLWGACFNGIKTRQCYDSNNCKISYNKPIEITGCGTEVPLEENKFPGFFILFGFVVFALLVWVFVLLLGKGKIIE